MKYYLLGDKSDSSTWRVEIRNHIDPNTIGESPVDVLTNLPEDVAWLQIESVEQGDGSFRDEITVNSVVKNSIQNQRAIEEADRKTSEAARRAQAKQRRDEVRAMKPDQLKDLNDIKASIRAIWKYLKDRDGI